MRKKRFGPFNIRSLIISFFTTFMIVVFIVISLVFYSFTVVNMKTRAVNENKVILSQMNNSISRYLTMTEDLFQIMKDNYSLRKYLRYDYSDQEVGDDLKAQFSATLSSIPDLRNDIVSIFIFNRYNRPVYIPDGVSMKDNADITKTIWYKAAQAAKGQSVITTTQVRTFTLEPNPWVIPLSAEILDTDGKTVIGTILLELNYKVIDNICSEADIGDKGYVFMIDSSGNIVYHPQLQLIYTGLKSEQITNIMNTDSDTLEMPEYNKMYTVSRLPDTDFTLIRVTYIDEIIPNLNQLTLLYVVLILLVALLSMLGSTQLSGYIVRPLRKLDEGVLRIEQGDLDVRFSDKGTVETEHLASSLNSMLDRINELMKQIVNNQQVIRQSELKALQSQINPHFLSNTLESIIWIAEDEGNERISNIAIALANYFRLALAGGSDVLTIEDELEHVRSYLVIQKMRYEKYLDYSIRVADEVRQCLTVKLIVQPIVENAIYHGIKDTGRHGTIDISARGDGNNVIIEVTDDGMGIPPSVLRNIFDPSKQPRRRIHHGGVGLKNIRERIKLLYGDEYGVEIMSKYRCGTTVRITIPKRYREDTDA